MPESAPIMDGDPARDSLTGKVLGEFEIGDRVGIGGGGEVYRAQDTSLKVAVALKRLPPALRNDAIYRRRFKEEAQRAVQLRHSNRVAHVYRVIEEQNEICLIMEFVEGETLRQRLVRPIQLKEFLHIASQCAEALVAAHGRGIIHGDIKPENIMLTPDGQVKILDFGVAKQMPLAEEISLMDRDTIDRKGTVSGTPAYMAPEVLREGVDGRADIFSMGIVFYEALTGQHPFRSEGFEARSGYIVGDKYAPASSLNPDVSKAIDQVLDRMLAKKPADRYPSALELLDDIDRLRNVITPPRGIKLLPQKDPQPVRKGFLWGTVAVLAAVFAGWGIYAWMNPPPVLKERGWVLISDFDRSGDDPVPDKSIREGLTIALQQSRYVNVLPRDRVYDALKRMKRPDVARIDENLGREICLRENAQVLLAGSIEHIGNAYQITVRGVEPVHGTMIFAEQEHFNRKEDLFDKVDAISRAVRKDLGESLKGIQNTSKPLANVTTGSLEALRLYSQAKDYVDKGSEGQALPLLQESVARDPDFAMAHRLLARVYLSHGNRDQELKSLTRAYELRSSLPDRERYLIEGDYYGSQGTYEKQLESMRVLVDAYPDDPDAHYALALAYYAVGNVSQAVPHLRSTIEKDPHAVLAYGYLIRFLARQNANSEALRLSEEATSHNIHASSIDWGEGLALLGEGRVDDARERFRRLLDAGGSSPSKGRIYLAEADIYEGKFTSAEKRLEEAIPSEQAAHQRSAELLERYLLANVFLEQGKTSSARRQLEAILAAPEPGEAGNLLRAGILYARMKDITRARAALHGLKMLGQNAPSIFNESCYQDLNAEIALAQGHPGSAVKLISTALADFPYTVSHQGLAKAYEMQGDWVRASVEWRFVLDAKGEILQDFSPTDWVLAHLQLARSYRMMKNTSGARSEYGDFLKIWGEKAESPKRKDAADELKHLNREVN